MIKKNDILRVTRRRRKRPKSEETEELTLDIRINSVEDRDGFWYVSYCPNNEIDWHGNSWYGWGCLNIPKPGNERHWGVIKWEIVGYYEPKPPRQPLNLFRNPAYDPLM